MTLPLLLDPEAAIIRSWGVLNEESGAVPHPTVLVIGPDGRVRYRWTNPDYKQRPSPDTLLEALGDG